MNFELAIPSYKRAVTLREKTLKVLQGCTDIDPKRITVFVADDNEKREYTRELDRVTYGKIVVGVPGMGAIRNYVQRHYPEGQAVLHIDDDIAALQVRVTEKQLAPFHELGSFAGDAFDVCRRVGARLWGIYPVNNPYFMKATVSTDLKYVIGSMWGSINTHDDVLTVSLDDKEDFERTLKCYAKDGVVVRFNHVTCKSNYYGEPGGMQVERTEERVLKSARALVARYPHLCTLNLGKKSGHAEVRLRDSRPRARP